jgi:hypothetical protein
MTKEELLEKYVNAYDAIASADETYICMALTRNLGLMLPAGIIPFTELILFAPSKEILISGFNWTDHVTHNPDVARYLRLTILSFCIAMCED